MVKLSAAHDTRLALLRAKQTDPSKRPEDFPGPSEDAILGEYTDFCSRTGGFFVMDTTWTKSAVRNPLIWWQTWASHLPAMQSIAQKVMKLPMSFAAGERSFSNAGNIQGRVCTPLSHHSLHQLLYVYFNSRALNDSPVSHYMIGAASGAGGAWGGDECEGDENVPSEGEGLDMAAAARSLASIVDEE